MLKSFLSIFNSKNEVPETSSYQGGILEIASIFIRVGKLDDSLDPIEIKTIKELLLKRFNINDSQLDKIIRDAGKLEAEINDNVQLTKKIKSVVDYEERYELLKDTWQIILSDKIKSSEEVTYMRLFSKLLGLSDKDNALARKEISKADENK
jgi:uncharacterized tellurite resistance protein B-like protein